MFNPSTVARRTAAARSLATPIYLLILCLGPGAFTTRPARADDPTAEAFFENRIRPVLSSVCLRCHGERKTSGGLRLDSRESMTKGGDSGPAIDPAHLDESLLLEAVRRAKDVSAMPPDRPLPQQQVADLTAWVRAGAPGPNTPLASPAPTHWSFQPIRDRAAAPCATTNWPRTTIDRFILARLEAAGRKPAAACRPPDAASPRDLRPDRPAARRRKRSTPFWPTTSPGRSPGSSTACSPRRTTASAGAGTGSTSSATPTPPAKRPTIPCRRPGATATTSSTRSTTTSPTTNSCASRSPATCSPASGPTPSATPNASPPPASSPSPGASASTPQNYHHLTIEDTIDTLGQAVLGLTLGCARCHDHKFDPITSERLLRSVRDLRQHAATPSPARKEAAGARHAAAPAAG